MRTTMSFALAALMAVTGAAWAAGEAQAGVKSQSQASGDAMAMTDGEVRKIDMDNKKITLKHGEIKNLQMPGMTMVFQVQDPAMLSSLKTGDKVRFMADKMNGALTVTHIEPAK